MICSSIDCDLGFILRSVRGIMSCFFGCFRVKDDNNRHLISDAVSSKNRDPLVSRNRLASLLLAEDKEGCPRKDNTHHSLESPNQTTTDKELVEEAKFLKSCGTLVETPAEIRKTSEGVNQLTPRDGNSENSKFHSWLPSTSIKKLDWEEQPNHTFSHAKLCEELEREAGSPEHKTSRSSESSRFGSPDASDKVLELIEDGTPSSANPEIVVTERINKSVQFECDPSSIESSKQSGDSTGNCEKSKWSPNPTPLKLTEEMQTPGTVYATNLENFANEKNPRIRSQYVYPILNHVQDFSQLKVPKEVDSLSSVPELSESSGLEHTYGSYSRVSKMEEGQEAKVGKSDSNNKVDATISPKDEIGHPDVLSGSKSHSIKTPDADRPILGTVAAHWNNEEPSRISPKWWDGNGIPNSTNKYKEDQKVSWHATPFEERLEKALSDESLVFAKKPHESRPIDFDETEEGDTAISRLQPSSHPESVTSF